jgi:hypothetical protein
MEGFADRKKPGAGVGVLDVSAHAGDLEHRSMFTDTEHRHRWRPVWRAIGGSVASWLISAQAGSVKAHAVTQNEARGGAALDLDGDAPQETPAGMR